MPPKDKKTQQPRQKSSLSTGKAGENLASNYLQQRGYLILISNFKCKLGEIDIIAKDGSTIVFVEVKTRWSLKFGAPEEAATKAKVKKIKKAAQFFLKTNELGNENVRIEVVAIDMTKKPVLFKLIIVDE